MRFNFRSSTSIVTVNFKNHFSSSSHSHPSRILPSSSPSPSTLSSPRLSHISEAKRDHVFMVKQGTYNSLFLQNKLLQAYTKTREFHNADKLFDEMPLRDIVTWNITIHGVFQRNGDINHKALLGFHYLNQILLSEVSLDHVTFIGLIRLCTDSTEAGMQLHCLILKQGLESNRFLSTTLVDFYGKCGYIVEARRVFDTVLSKDSVLCNALVASYVLNGMINEAFVLLTGFKGDEFTFSSLLSGCLKIEQGKMIHAIVIKLSYQFDVQVATALVNMYSKTGGRGGGDMRDARACFESMVVRNVVSWNAMIVGYGTEAMRILVQMIRENVKPDELTFASVLSSCAKSSSIREIKQLQGFITKSGYVGFLSVANSLINAYSKNGGLSDSLLCFDSIQEPDLVSLTSIIGGLAFHGFAEESLRIFEKNKLLHQPDKIIYLEILTACSHGGLVQQGIHYFKEMTETHKIEPSAEHYACLIDLLGRAGFIDEAFDVLTSMPIEPSKDALAAFTGACSIHEKREESMKWTAKKLLETEPSKSVNYSVLSNAYLSDGHWNQAEKLRKTERRNCNNNSKTPGCSWIGD